MEIQNKMADLSPSISVIRLNVNNLSALLLKNRVVTLLKTKSGYLLSRRGTSNKMGTENLNISICRGHTNPKDG